MDNRPEVDQYSGPIRPTAIPVDGALIFQCSTSYSVFIHTICLSLNLHTNTNTPMLKSVHIHKYDHRNLHGMPCVFVIVLQPHSSSQSSSFHRMHGTVH